MFSERLINEIERDFNEAKPRLEGRRDALFHVFDDASPEEVLCLKYIYSYLPLSDATAYDGDLFLKLVRDALAARDRFPWGARIPEEIFLNYVVAVRVNNEDITDHREIFADELASRIEGMDLTDASLEVNVWCYEKATYQATDSRTVSPLTIIRRGFGRCGEESTFTVSALRSVAIPARQCYTPRWAHSDDNHAWVEVWIDGQWHYLGACEPEAVLNKGWFSAPANRGMLIETRVFSNILGDEEVVKRGSGMTLINVSDNYFPTAILTVTVTKDGQPSSGAQVDFCVVNYAEFSSIVRLTTDATGEASLKTGRGELFVRVTQGGQYVEQKLSLMDGDRSITIDLSDQPATNAEIIASSAEIESHFALRMRAPIATAIDEVQATEVAEEAMAKKKAAAEQTRAAFIASFMPAPDPESSDKESLEWRRAKLLADSLGNHAEIEAFLDEKKSAQPLELKLDLLEALNYKDLSDSTADVLLHHLEAAAKYQEQYPADVFKHYLLNPRIGMEMISAWRDIVSHFNHAQQEGFIADPKQIWQYANERFTDAGDYDYGIIMADPIGLTDLGIASRLSRRIFTIALSRSLGIPARINRQDYQLEFYKEKSWQRFSDEAIIDTDALRNSSLILRKADPEESIDYGTHFSLAKLSEAGHFETLGYYRERFDDAHEMKFKLEPGHYQLLLCRRQASGDQEVRIQRFFLAAESTKELELRLPELEQNEADLHEFLAIELADTAFTVGEEDQLLALLSPGGEPTEHFMNEMLSAHEDMKPYSKQIRFVLQSEKGLENEKLNRVRELYPDIQVSLAAEGFDLDAYIEESFESYGLHNRQWPLLVLVRPDVKVKLAISGYQVGSVAQILDQIK